jgi:hypothetical protein
MIIAPEKFGGQNSAYRHLNMKGAFGNEGALRFFILGGHPNTRADIPQFFGFVAHVGEEGFTAEFSVAGRPTR